MDYSFENLGDERFQEFCQALLLKENPNMQCFPVGQKDGGRDITENHYRHRNRQFIVYQVKFVRNPNAITDPHKWLTKVCEEEAPKVASLLPRGAVQYYLVTNVRGTAPLDVGSIDKVQGILDTHFPIPAQCLWRDDLNRRLDTNWDLKWSYPEVMSGIDAFRALLEQAPDADFSRCTDVIRRFVLTQFESDREVRFKQVELQNDLFELFVDVPLEFGGNWQRTEHGEGYIFERDGEMVYALYEDDNGAAATLLQPSFQERYQQIVLLGGPGQGKSTLTQLICQVYRLRLLNRSSELSRLPESLRPKSLKIPFRVDLRHLSVWLKGQNPFSITNDDDDAAKRIPQWEKSLESFLAAQVRHESGGNEFSVQDLFSIAKRSALLIVLDGLDEVADISSRKEVVRAITIGIKRLRLDSPSIQVIVTTRPSAFSNSPGFPEKEYYHFTLGPLNRKLINQFADNWIEAKRIRLQTANEIRGILKTKMEQPHLRDLAKNPMQLAILLSLIHMRGSSLPDKRTALYDNYVELFFNREAEKSLVVRDNREILVDLHRYLAYVLHSEAEKIGNRNSATGRIASEQLRTTLRSYLEAEGRDLSLVDTLFEGTVERVVFLVSRIEGTLEFEVQPLREYFAARYLYETAPYSPPGRERKGTKPDRFDAISRNFYWLNVTRFYAGCFSKGELPTLIDRLQELANDGGYRLISHPRVLTAMLLSDWTFNQHTKSQSLAIKLVLDGVGPRFLLSSESSNRRDRATLTLTDGCGREQLVQECFEILCKFPAVDFTQEIISLIRSNATKGECIAWWRGALQGVDLNNLPRWMSYAQWLGFVDELSDSELLDIINRSNQDPNICSVVIRSRHSIIETDTELTAKVIDGILDGKIIIPYTGNRRPQSVILRLARLLDTSAYERMFEYTWRSPGEFFTRHFPTEPDKDDKNVANPSNDEIGQWINAIERCEGEWDKNLVDWTMDIEPWEHMIQETQLISGTRWVHYESAILSSAVKANLEKSSQHKHQLYDDTVPLCRRAQESKKGSLRWWHDQLKGDYDNTKIFILALFFSWTSTAIFKALKQDVTEAVEGLTDEEWAKLARIVRMMGAIRGPKGKLSINKELLDGSPSRIVTLIGMRCKQDYALQLYSQFLSNYSGNDKYILDFCVISALKQAIVDDSHWVHALSVISSAYTKEEAHIDRIEIFRALRTVDCLPQGVLEAILGKSEDFPRELVSAAEAMYRDLVASNITPIVNLSKVEQWFESH